MGLTSGPLLWLAIAVATGAIAATTWLWPRLAGRRVWPVTARLGLIAIGQVLIVAAALTYLNDSFGFFSSWSELLGSMPASRPTASLPVTAHAAAAQPIVITGSTIGTTFPGGPALGRNAGGRPDGAGVRLSAGHLTAPARAISAAARSGLVLRVTIRGQYSGIVGTNDYIYLPPEYFQPGYATARFPVVLAFSGYPNDPLNLIRLLRLPAVAARLGAAGLIRPAIYLMVNPSVALPRDTECTNIPAGLQVATFFGTDLPLAVQRTFRTQSGRTGWATLGYSTGAYCAAKITMLYPGQFSAAVGLSGYYVAIRDRTTGNLYGGSRGYRRENDLRWRMAHLPAPPVSVLVASSASGEKSLPGTRAFLRLIRPPMRGYSLILRRGGHNYFTWRRELPQSLEWLSRRLSPVRTPPTVLSQVPAPRHAVAVRPVPAPSSSQR